MAGHGRFFCYSQPDRLQNRRQWMEMIDVENIDIGF